MMLPSGYELSDTTYWGLGDMIVVVSAGYIVVYQKEYVGAEEYHQEIMSNFLTQYQWSLYFGIDCM